MKRRSSDQLEFLYCYNLEHFLYIFCSKCNNVWLDLGLHSPTIFLLCPLSFLSPQSFPLWLLWSRLIRGICAFYPNQVFCTHFPILFVFLLQFLFPIYYSLGHWQNTLSIEFNTLEYLSWVFKRLTPRGRSLRLCRDTNMWV